MTTKQPEGGQRQYVEKPVKVYAEQYLVGAPLPIGAIEAIEPIYPASGGPYASTTTGIYPLVPTDWILTDRFTGQAESAISHEQFVERFGSAVE